MFLCLALRQPAAAEVDLTELTAHGRSHAPRVNVDHAGASPEPAADGGDFFFSSRSRHMRFDCDWSSDVCSSDLAGLGDEVVTALPFAAAGVGTFLVGWGLWRLRPWRLVGVATRGVAHGARATRAAAVYAVHGASRSEERRVGEEGRARWAPYHSK